MSRKVNITCRYYNVVTYTENNDTQPQKYDLLEWLNKMASITLAERTKTMGQTKGRLDDTSVNGHYYALNFVKMESYSSTYIVTEEKSAKHVDISIENDEYIGKNTVAIYDSKKSCLMLMGNQGGFSAHNVTSYINSFYEKPVCILEPVKLKKDFSRPENKFGKIQIKISSVDDYRCSKGNAYEDALEKARSMGASTASFEFSVGRNRSKYLDANIVRTIISDAFTNMGAVSIARVKMEDEDGTAIYNLFEDVKNEVISLTADSKGEIAYKTIAKAMVEAYK